MSYEIEMRTRERPLLIITDRRGDVARIGSDGMEGIGIQTRPSLRNVEAHDGAIVRVTGQDLTALRDLILSLPEDAFPELPKPPYISPNGWVEGDIVIYHQPENRGQQNPGPAYVRNEAGLWESVWTQNGCIESDDETIDQMIDLGTHVALRQGGRFTQ